ncbi:uncharacterized protein BX663DRAFT_553653 [Cokeromyces recurvatus]|uniref:uncharacterized protein n=1 Tax=Cokeromyces recurvatus TaxID=90255 RepID=UPI00221FDB99|nr:uncharacterized protein BX663DRAFT_553653 [Cokeromyces recurvatus]KAI7901018.1 hypothetical protein BX663DRAFT_553653 [Cokeromyces recurvatus]
MSNNIVSAMITESVVDNQQIKNEPVNTTSVDEGEAAVIEKGTDTIATPVTTTEEQASKVEETTETKLLSKRRTIFNPFGKSKKDEQVNETELSTEEAEKSPTKKASKGFGNFFTRSKSSHKVDENIAAATGTNEDTIVSTELLQNEQLQCTEADTNIEETDNIDKKESTNKEAVNEVSENVQTEAMTEVEQVHPIAIKRQSFISKLFGKKKQETTRETEPEEDNMHEDPVADSSEVHEESNTDKAASRPTSPLGRLTELFSSKKNHKKVNKATNNDSEQATEEAAANTAEEEKIEKESDNEDTIITTDAVTNSSSSPAAILATA